MDSYVLFTAENDDGERVYVRGLEELMEEEEEQDSASIMINAGDDTHSPYIKRSPSSPSLSIKSASSSLY